MSETTGINNNGMQDAGRIRKGGFERAVFLGKNQKEPIVRQRVSAKYILSLNCRICFSPGFLMRGMQGVMMIRERENSSAAVQMVHE